MIDWTRIAELRNDVLGEDFAEVFEIFTEEIETVLRRLRDTPNFSTIEDDFHLMKGSAVNMGFFEFGELCRAAEKACAAGNAMAIDVEQLFDCYELSLDALKSRSEELGLAA